MTTLLKKLLTGAVVLCLGTVLATAQARGGEVSLRSGDVPDETIKYFNARIYRIRDYRDSYVITYQKQTGGHATLVISKQWYRDNPQKLKFRKLDGVLYPYMSVFYTEGQFNHIKLSVPLSRSNPVWGWIAASNTNVPDPVPDNLPGFQY